MTEKQIDNKGQFGYIGLFCTTRYHLPKETRRTRVVMAEKRSFVLDRFLKKAAPFMSLLLMVVLLTLLSPYFLTLDNLTAIALQMSVVAIMAIGQMLVIISAGIDLAAGSVMAFSGVVAALMMSQGFGIWPAIIAGLMAGLACGLFSGVLIAKGHLPPFIATLGMMGIGRGLALLLTGGKAVFGLPQSFSILGGGRIADLAPGWIDRWPAGFPSPFSLPSCWQLSFTCS